jgi:mannosyl-3-phosphoglycerate synthase
VRVFWASKPGNEGNRSEKVLGRCSSVVSPVIGNLLESRFGLNGSQLMISNAGEQGMNISAAHALRFSSGYSVETFQLMELLAKGAEALPSRVLIQQYEARAAHLHEKGDEEHIKQMIAESLGSLYHFERLVPESVRRQVAQIVQDKGLVETLPRVYPALATLDVQADESFVERYRLSEGQVSLPEKQEEGGECAS